MFVFILFGTNPKSLSLRTFSFSLHGTIFGPQTIIWKRNHSRIDDDCLKRRESEVISTVIQSATNCLNKTNLCVFFPRTSKESLSTLQRASNFSTSPLRAKRCKYETGFSLFRHTLHCHGPANQVSTIRDSIPCSRIGEKETRHRKSSVLGRWCSTQERLC